MDSLTQLLNRKVVPPRNMDHVAVTAAALEVLERIVAQNSQNEELLRRGREAFATKVENEIRKRLPDVHPVPVELMACSPQRKALTLRTGAPQVFVPEQLANLPLDEVCEPPASSGPASADPCSAPDARVDATPSAQMQLVRTLPSSQNVAAKSGAPAAMSTNGQKLSALTLREAGIAAGWTGHLGRIAAALHDDKNYKVVQAFYVSAHGATANWSETGRSSCDIYTKDDGYSLAERPYMIELRDNFRASKLTTVNLGFYVDAGGKGIVATTCVADVDPMASSIRGAACVDYQPTPAAEFRIGQSADFGLLTGRIEPPPYVASKLAERTGSFCIEDREGDQVAIWRSIEREVAPIENPICHVPLSTDNNLWLQLSYRKPDAYRWLYVCLLAAISTAVLVYATKMTAAWRAAEARLGLLRDLPAAIVQVDNGPLAKVLGASDRAEELVGEELPSFIVPGPGFEKADAIQTQFWTLFARDGYEIERHANGSESIAEVEDIAAATISKREKGLSSIYMVRLKCSPRTSDLCWLEVQGTPELGERSKNPTSFSLITRPDPLRVQQVRFAAKRQGST